MRISIVVYDVATANRIKKNTYKYFSVKTTITQEIICLKDIYIEFQGRLIIINWDKSDESVLQQYMDTVLMGEEVTINSMNSLQYCEAYGKSPRLLVNYTE